MRTALVLHRDRSFDLSTAVAEFLAECRLRRLSPTTLQWYQYALGPFVRFAVARGEGDVGAVTTKTVRAFLAEQSQRVQARRLNHYRGAIDRFYRWLLEEGYADLNPAAQIAKIREPKRLIGALNQSEIQALLTEPDPHSFIGLRDYTFMRLLDTGVRLSEALGLHVGDLPLPPSWCHLQ